MTNQTNKNKANQQHNAQQAPQAPQSQSFEAVAPPQAPTPPQAQGFPAIQGVYNYMSFGQNGEMYKVDETTGEWRLANEQDIQLLFNILTPKLQGLMSHSIPGYDSLIPQIQSLLRNR